MEEINSKITLVDDTVIFKAGQTTESEEFDAKFEGELRGFINLVSPDLMVDSWDPPYGSAPSSLVHTFGAELTRIYHRDVSVFGKRRMNLLRLLWNLSLVAKIPAPFPMSFLMRILFSPTSWRLTSTAAISKNFI